MRTVFSLALVAMLAASCTTVAPVACGPVPIRDAQVTGTASAVRVLGVWVKGDASIAAAAHAGGVLNVATVDERTTGVLGVYVKRTTVVTGTR